MAVAVSTPALLRFVAAQCLRSWKSLSLSFLMNEAAFICAHNHPSSDPTPSPEDRVLTQRLRHGAELLGIVLLDHVILGEDRHFSFADQGWPAT